MYKVFTNIIPISLSKLFNKLDHSYTARRNNNFYIYPVRTNLGKFNIAYRGPKEWNNLPPDAQTAVHIESFKKLVKGVFIESMGT